MLKRGTGAKESPYDIRTFSHPVKAYPKASGGVKYDTADIHDQGLVGICTAISIVQNASKALGKKFSADFQYLIQKKYVDKDWEEGSAIISALKAAKGVEDKDGNFLYGGFLPEENWKFTISDDRNLTYDEYIKKLQAIPESEIQKLFAISKNYRLKAYASVPVNRDAMAQAIDSSVSGVITRYSIGQEWWTNKAGKTTWDKNAIEPLRPPAKIISGHAVIDTNFAGNSFRIANSWSPQWADGGTAYRIQDEYAPTECWSVFYYDVPPEIQKQMDNRASIIGQILDYIQKIINLLINL